MVEEEVFRCRFCRKWRPVSVRSKLRPLWCRLCSGGE